ncbi:M48 family metallopeptidase [Aeromonas dhakensis]|uniref:M48 family metallopeptidase n=1 Tax=Aeromonas dhakensis TaxID=196024 RepID=UPI00244259AA|nr:SprT family zinc-dependent metalloprotease [Aeromonas dhakensis]
MPKKIEQILEQKRSWIYRNLAEWEDLNRTHVERQFVSGEGFPYLGSNYRLKLVDDQQEDLILKNGYFLMRRDRADRGMELFKHFYRNKGLSRVTKRVTYYAPKLGVDYRTVRVMELQHHWASCSTKGDLNFHWRCLMAPLSVLDYIVVHELAHRLHRNHNAAFWDAVDKVLPDYQKQVSWLKHNGAGMTL